MGAVCTCSEDDQTRNDIEDQTEEARLLIAGDRLFRENKLGGLFNLQNAWLNQESGYPEFKKIEGPWPQFLSSCQVMKVNQKMVKDQVPTLDGPCLVVGPNTKLELLMNLVQGIFLNQNVYLRIKLELERQSDDYEPLAALKVGTKCHTAFIFQFNQVVLNATQTIDIGYAMNDLNVDKRDTYPGQAQIQIIYIDSSGMSPFKIKSLKVYTEECLPDETYYLSSLQKKDESSYHQEVPNSRAHGVPDKYIAQADIQEPVLLNGTLVNGTEKMKVFCYYNPDKSSEVAFDIPFTIGTATLSCLDKFYRKLQITLELCAEHAKVVFAVNGRVQQLDHNQDHTVVASNSSHVKLELTHKEVCFENVLRVSTQGCPQYLGVIGVRIDVV